MGGWPLLQIIGGFLQMINAPSQILDPTGHVRFFVCEAVVETLGCIASGPWRSYA